MPVTIKLRNFKLIDLEKATSNFEEVLGKGRSRNVYKGWVHENSYDPSTPDIGLPVAVKRFIPECEQGHEKWQVILLPCSIYLFLYISKDRPSLSATSNNHCPG